MINLLFQKADRRRVNPKNRRLGLKRKKNPLNLTRALGSAVKGRPPKQPVHMVEATDIGISPNKCKFTPFF
jgi:hypothetical protein